MGQKLSFESGACPANMEPACVINGKECTEPISNDIESFGQLQNRQMLFIGILALIIMFIMYNRK